MSLAPKASSLSEVEMTELIMPQHTNAFHSVFGGVVMSWVDIAAATCAMRHAHKSVVTASIDAMHFLAPIKLGWIASIKAKVNYTSRTSCEVGVKVTSENPVSQEKYHTASAYLTMVALDSHGRPTIIPQVLAESESEKRRYEEAKARRAARLGLKRDLETRRQKDSVAES